MPAIPSDPLIAKLDRIRERNSAASTYDDWHQVGCDGCRLLAAVTAVLEKAGEWEAQAARLYRLDDRASWSLEACAEELREAITAALSGTGKGASDE